MPRTARAAPGGYCFHALNRGNRRAQVFHDADDYHAFVRLLRRASARVPVRLLGYCLMPNHFHLVPWPRGDGDLSAWVGWLLTAHVRAYQRRYRSTGHVWQGRFKAFPIQEDGHLLAVLRYVERNPLRAGLVARAEDWPWSSLRWRLSPPLWPFLEECPVALPAAADWAALVNAPQTEAKLTALRACVRRDRPFGGAPLGAGDDGRAGVGVEPATAGLAAETRRRVGRRAGRADPVRLKYITMSPVRCPNFQRKAGFSNSLSGRFSAGKCS